MPPLNILLKTSFTSKGIGFFALSTSRFGLNGPLSSTPKISLKDKLDNSYKETLPANDSETFSIILNFCDPVSQNKPLLSLSSIANLSTISLIFSNIEGTF